MQINIITPTTNRSSYDSDKLPNPETIKMIAIDKSELTKQEIWENIRKGTKEAQLKGHSGVIICTKTELFENIDQHIIPTNVLEDAYQLNAKILIINTDNADLMVPVSSELVWVDYCSGIKIVMIFESCFPLILMEGEIDEETIDEKLCRLTSNKFIVYPMQKVKINKKSEVENLNQRIGRLIKQSEILYT